MWAACWSFLPIIVTLFFFLSILEDTGYMARVAFVMDKLLRKIGLSGRSIVPMLIGFGCSVPAIMATRTVSSDRDRKMTILLTPYHELLGQNTHLRLFYRSVFHRRIKALVMISLYVLGIVIGILAALVMKQHRLSGQACSLCHGAAQLPAAVPQERGAAAVGKGHGTFCSGRSP